MKKNDGCASSSSSLATMSNNEQLFGPFTARAPVKRKSFVVARARAPHHSTISRHLNSSALFFTENDGTCHRPSSALTFTLQLTSLCSLTQICPMRVVDRFDEMKFTEHLSLCTVHCLILTKWRREIDW